MPASGPSGLQGSNYSEELKAAGLQAATPLIKNYDYSGAVGGPIRRGPVVVLHERADAGQFAVRLQHLPQQERGQPQRLDLRSRTRAAQAFRDRTWDNANLRLTAQITPRNKLNIFWDEQRTCRECENGGNNWAPQSPRRTRKAQQPIIVKQGTWTSTVSNRVLLEFGAGEYHARWGGCKAKEDPYTGDLIRMVEQCTAGCAVNGEHPRADLPLAEQRPLHQRAAT